MNHQVSQSGLDSLLNRGQNLGGHISTGTLAQTSNTGTLHIKF